MNVLDFQTFEISISRFFLMSTPTQHGKKLLFPLYSSLNNLHISLSTIFLETIVVPVIYLRLRYLTRISHLIIEQKWSKSSRSGKSRREEKERCLNGHAHRSWVSGFQSLLPLRPVISILPHRCGGRQKEAKRPTSMFGRGRRGGWMAYGEEEVTASCRLHLLQNAISSLSSIPHLISSNNLPFSSCPNRESQKLREWVCRRESQKSLLHPLFLTLTLSLSTSVGWW